MQTEAELIGRIDACLPQTQCTRCGYPRCRAYAEALARGETDINRCPPGGDEGIRLLAQLLGVAGKPLDPACGAHGPRLMAVIEEADCIGCTLCIKACPVDAIAGAAKQMHTVLTAECTGCGLCLAPCPVDCIRMEATAPPADAGPWTEYTRAQADHWRARTETRLARRGRKRAPRPDAAHETIFPEAEKIRADIQAALARAKARRSP